jgi:predicted phage-related endonuclease
MSGHTYQTPEEAGFFREDEDKPALCSFCGFVVEPEERKAHDRECGHDAWLASRMERIGASEVGCLFDANEYETRAYLIGRKVGTYPYPDIGEGGDHASAAEPWVITRARKKFGWDIVRAPQTQLSDLVCSRLGATPDAYVKTPWGHAVAQIKVASCKPYELVKKYGKAPPLMYQLQVQAEMAVTGCKLGCLLVMHTMGGLMLRAYPIARHEGAIERIRYEVDRTWAEIETERQKVGYYNER